MARYYDIQLFAPGNTGTTPTKRWTSFPNGQNDPGALNVVLDAYVFSFDASDQQTVVQIWGVAIQDLMQANNFTGWQIKIFAGFQAGLPLNNPAQAGLIIEGLVFQSFGNWVGTDQTIDFVVVLNGSLTEQQSNIVLNWQAGKPLAAAIANTLTVAFPGLRQSINISPKLVLNYTVQHVDSSLVNFSQMLRGLTQGIIGTANYPGVSISINAGALVVQDGTVSAQPTQILFQELIGQPTWQVASTITFICPMRSDLAVGDFIKLPQGLTTSGGQGYGAPGAVTTTSASNPQGRQNVIFNGTFLVNRVHHMGQYRNPSPDGWVTVIDAVGQVNGVAASGT